MLSNISSPKRARYALGQATAAGSVPVVIASDQSAVATTATTILAGKHPTNNANNIAVSVTNAGALHTAIVQPRSAFGEVLTSTFRPQVQQSFAYNEILPCCWETYTGVGGTVSAANSTGQLDITSTTNSYAVIRSFKRLHYRPGLGAGIRLAARFHGPPVANTIQTAGMATSGNGFAVGYNGTVFGILRASGGKPEIRTLTVTTGANGSETGTTVNLAGQTAVGVVVTASAAAASPVNFTAYQIASSGTWTGLSTGISFYADQEEDTVVFTTQGVRLSLLDAYYDGAYGSNLGYKLNSTGGTMAGTFHEVTLTVTTAANSSETGTVTLNGTAVNVSLTNAGGNKATTATEIAASNFSSANFTAVASGSTVLFRYSNKTTTAASLRDGTYSFSSTGAAVAAVTDSSRWTTGVVKTDTWVAQSSFNLDTLDGAGPSALTLDPTKGNVYQIQYQWLGFGAIDFSVENPATGKLEVFHRIRHANANTVPSVDIPSMPAEFTLAGVPGQAHGSAMTMRAGSVCMFIEGQDATPEPLYSTSATQTMAVANTEYNVCAIRNRRTYRGTYNQIQVRLQKLSVTTALGTNKIGTVRLYMLGSDGTLGAGTTADYPNFVYHKRDSSAVVIDTTSTTRSIGTTGGGELMTVTLAANEGRTIDLADLEVYLEPTQTIVVTGEGTGTGDIKVSVTWREVH